MPTGYNVQVKLKRGEPLGVTKKASKRAIHLATLELKGNLGRNSSVDEGKMQGSWLISPTDTGLNRKIISSAIYTPYVNDGTGIYKTGRYIYPRTRKALRFEYKGKIVYAKRVKGQRGQKFVEKSITQTQRRNDEFIIRAVMETAGDL